MRPLSTTTPLAAAVVAAAIAAIPCRAAEPATAVRERNVIRKQLPKNVNSIALEYTVVAIDDTGRERFVDPHKHTFKVGDSFLVRIKPQDDVYVYVFTFAEPAGEEKLVVVALQEPSDDLKLLTSAVFKAGRTGAAPLTSRQAAAKKEADAKMETLRQRSAGGVQSRGPVRKVVERADGLGAGQRVTHVEPPQGDETSSYGIAVSTEDPELFLDIPLRSSRTARQ